jgi:hypothetical protein
VAALTAASTDLVMQARDFVHVPVVDAAGGPTDVVNARDATAVGGG